MKIETAGQKLNGLPSIIEKTMREERRILLYPLLLIQLLWGSSQGEESIPESGRIQWSQKNYSVNETQGLVYLQARRAFGSEGALTVYYNTIDGSAIQGEHYVEVKQGVVEWADGEIGEKDVMIPLVDNVHYEVHDKSFQVTLRAPEPTSESDLIPSIFTEYQVASVVILGSASEDAQYGELSFSQASAWITAEDHVISIPILRQNGQNGQVSVQVTVEGTSATADVDYRVDNSDLTFVWSNQDTTVQYLNISILHDAVYESSTEVIELSLISPVNAKLGSFHSLEVHVAGPNDVAHGTIQFRADCFPGCPSQPYAYNEGSGAPIYVERVNGSDGVASVKYETLSNGSAISGVDFVPTSGSFSWKDGEADTKVFYVKLIQDQEFEPEETVPLLLSHATGATFGLFRTSEITITGNHDDERPGELSFATTDSGVIQKPIVVHENVSSVELIIRRRGGAHGPASVDVSTYGRTAIAGVHFQALSEPTTLTWDDREDQDQTIQILILDNTQYAALPRTFVVRLHNTMGANVGLVNEQDIVIAGPNDDARVTAFSLDLNLGKMTLVSSVEVDTSTFDPAKLIITVRDSPNSFVRLTSSTTTSSIDGSVVQCAVGSVDLNALKTLLKTSTVATLVIEPHVFGLIRPHECVGRTCHVPVFQETQVAPMVISEFTPDVTFPTLTGFTLDVLTTRLLKLHFSESVDVSTFDLSQLTFHADDDATPTFSVSCSSDSVVFSTTPNAVSGVFPGDLGGMPDDGTAITVLLSVGDVAVLREGSSDLGVTRDHTFLSWTAALVQDMAGNAIAGSSSPFQAAMTDCSVCPVGTYMSKSCTDVSDRECTTCTTCETGFYAIQTCSGLHDTSCYPCSVCRWEQYASQECSAVQNRVCSSCTRCTHDEHEYLPCKTNQNRICLTCDSCSLTEDQKKSCVKSHKWNRREMKNPYGCPAREQQYQSLEERLIAAKSHACGAGRCSCEGGTIGNANEKGDNFPQDGRCTGPKEYRIYI